MSSLHLNSTVSFDEKSKTFFRRDSLDKLQSSAYYTMHLAGKWQLTHQFAFAFFPKIDFSFSSIINAIDKNHYL